MLTALCVATAVPALAQSELPNNVRAEEPVLERATLGGRLWGARPDAEAAGITGGAATTFDAQQVLDGSRDTEETSLRHRAGVWLSADTSRLGWWDGGSFFLSADTHNDEDGPDIVGSIQGIDRLQDPDFDRVSELWFEQKLVDDRVRIKVGKIEPKSEFDYTRNSSNFLNKGTERAATILALPAPSTAAVLFVYPVDGLYAGIGVFDGAGLEGVPTGRRGPSTFFGDPADLFLIGEFGFNWGTATGHPGRVGFGAWHHTGTFARLAGGEESGAEGVYVTLDQQLWRADASDPADTRGVGAFFQYGFTDGDVSLVEHHVATGLQWTGPVSTRPLDVIGGAVSTVVLSDESPATADAEWALEAYYRVQLTPYAFLQPDLQYIINPAGDEDRENALVAGVRVGINF